MDSPPATTADPAPARRDHAVEFSGRAGEYFRIWIVNVALTVVTVGIYSAWAKVRNQRYFYGNTRLAGGSFEYTANPLNILKGRLLVLGAFLAYQAALAFQPLVASILMILIVPLVPWVVIKAISFNLRYSAWRGLRFHFDGAYGEAFRVYVLWTAAAVASFGLLYPYVAWRRKQFFVERARYGRSAFGFDGRVGWFYVVYIIAGIAYFGMALGAMLLAAGAAAAAAALGGDADPSQLDQLGHRIAIAATVVAYVGFLLLFLVVNTGVQAMIANHVWQHTRIADVRFDLRLELWRVLWIQVSNIVAIVASAGLLIPWARVRMARYRLSRFTLTAAPADLERFVASERERVEATGAEMGDALDLDLGL